MVQLAPHVGTFMHGRTTPSHIFVPDCSFVDVVEGIFQTLRRYVDMTLYRHGSGRDPEHLLFVDPRYEELRNGLPELTHGSECDCGRMVSKQRQDELRAMSE